MLLENAELMNNFCSFRVLWDSLSSRHVANIDRYVPIEGGTSLLRCTQCTGQTFTTLLKIGSDMCVTKHPQINAPLSILFPYRTAG